MTAGGRQILVVPCLGGSNEQRQAAGLFSTHNMVRVRAAECNFPKFLSLSSFSRDNFA